MVEGKYYVFCKQKNRTATLCPTLSPPPHPPYAPAAAAAAAASAAATSAAGAEDAACSEDESRRTLREEEEERVQAETPRRHKDRDWRKKVLLSCLIRNCIVKAKA